ncbi:MAG: cation:proton antiporter [Thermodesulfovibrionales bacterium]|nr:cation:proton antiporter [Thermodesulfovibrionales bacterium]
MGTSIALIILLGLVADYLFRLARLPGLVGMLLVGVVTGPYVLDLLDPALMEVSADFRLIALIVILLRAGLETRRDTLNRVGGTALVMSVLPAVTEGVAIMLIAPALLGITMLEAAILGSILAAVSPAVVVPYMIRYIDERRGMVKGIPTMILAASSVDDVFVIVVFSALMGMYAGAAGSIWLKLLEVPVAIVLGILVGCLTGYVLHRVFLKFGPRATKKTMIVIGVALFLVWLEEALKPIAPVSALLGIMTVGFILLELRESVAHQISQKLAKVWVMAEILLFVLVGAQVNIHVAWEAGAAGLVVIALGLVARSAGTWMSVQGAGFNIKEKMFCVVAYIPKATVQAAIGAIPLAAGVPGGEVILAVAVLSIIVTAPLGAIGIEMTGKRWLHKSPD